MIKIFVTGDLHIGRTYNRFSDVKEKLINSRFECLERMVRMAEEEGCGIFAVTGDTFDNNYNIKVSDVTRVVEILARFSGSVIVLPGNHDFYTEEVKLWKDFCSAMDKVDHNITLLNSFTPVPLEVGEERAVIYPAYCQSKHSVTNNLGWVRDSALNAEDYNIGLAHGAIQGITPDMNGEYFLMTEAELSAIPVDVWLIGHTHIPYPITETDKEISGYRIYNAGTPEQLDFHNNTIGLGYVIALEKRDNGTKITAKAVHTGAVRFPDKAVALRPVPSALEETLKSVAKQYDGDTIVRLKLSGAVNANEYNIRSQLYEKYLSGLLSYEVQDEELSAQITEDQIRAEFPEFGFAAQVLKELIDDPIEAQMAYNLLKECRE